MEEKETYILNGAKLEYATAEDGTRTQIKGLKTIPDIGSEPNKLDTTTLDNTKYETSRFGLIPSVDLTYDFNLELRDAELNIKAVCDLEDSGSTYYWWLTYPSGIVVSYQSKVVTNIKGGNSGELEQFSMYHTPTSELERTIPETSA